MAQDLLEAIRFPKNNSIGNGLENMSFPICLLIISKTKHGSRILDTC
jgi:hypothetical protein